MEIPGRAARMIKKGDEQKLAWWQLSLIGVGCIIGTGYFLGSGIGIRLAGPAIVISFLLAGIGTYIVSDALGRMSAEDPQKGSFRSYAKKAYGRWAGFSSGWVYWFSEMLIVGSQLTALSILSRFWFPNVPLWIFSTIFAILGVVVIILGTSGFEKAQNIFGIIKIAAILMFIVLAITVLFGFFGGKLSDFQVPKTTTQFLPKGIKGLWASLIFGFYAFGGIEIMGMMSTRLKDQKDAKKSGSIMLIILTIIYLISLFLATSLAGLDQFIGDQSPFVIALEKFKIGFFPHVFIACIIIAGFSTMTASLFAVTSMIVTLAKDGDAPKLFTKKGSLKFHPFALLLTIGGLVTSIILSLFMPDRIYEYVTTAAGLMLLFNWLFILISFPRLIKISVFDHVKRFTGMALILLAISGTFIQKTSRPSLFISLGFVLIVFIALFVVQMIRKKREVVYPKQP